MSDLKLRIYFDDYALSHTHSGNKLCHYLGIPLITLSLLGLLGRLSLGPVDVGLVFWLAVSIFYIRLNWFLGLSFSILTFALYMLAKFIPLEALGAFFVFGWLLQFVGHYRFEAKRPSFTQNILHLLIGPFWIFARAVGKEK